MTKEEVYGILSKAHLTPTIEKSGGQKGDSFTHWASIRHRKMITLGTEIHDLANLKYSQQGP